jgi:hypothetical protein
VIIYWKDFILKVFFNPAYCVVKRLGPTWALVLATVYSFFWTWILHDYQWLWLRGSITFTWQNSLFWMLLGLLVLASALWEMKRSRQRALHKVHRNVRTELYRAGCTIATFVSLCLLWSMWSCQSADELWHVLLAATNVTLPSALAVAAGLTGLGVAAILFGRSVQERNLGGLATNKATSEFGFWPSAGLLTAGAVGVLLFGMIPSLPGARDTMAGEVVQSLKQDRLNELDMNAQTRGYYEKLDVTREDVSVALAIHSVAWWPSIEMTEEREDFMLREPMPNFLAKPRGKVLRLNELGMRGPLYQPAKPPGVFRIALVGSSCELGRGVNDDETFGRLLEGRLNREDTDERIRKYEVLNFSVEGYGAIQKLYYFCNKGLAFDPDLVLWVSARREGERTADQLANAMKKGYEYPEPFGTLIHDICARAGVDGSTPFRQIERRLLSSMPQLTQVVYQQFAASCQEHHLRCCVVYRPESREFLHLQAADRLAIQQMAANAGLRLVDLKSSYEGIANREALMVDPDGSFDLGSMRRFGVDDHPNALAHQLLADELYRQLHAPENRDLLTPRDASRVK